LAFADIPIDGIGQGGCLLAFRLSFESIKGAGRARLSSRLSIHAAAVDQRSKVWLSPSKILPCRSAEFGAGQALAPCSRRRFTVVTVNCNMAFHFTTRVVNVARQRSEWQNPEHGHA
jgi:hypothetical protein